ncbi:hypothetical protein Bca101_076382 [Brassica carinata]
MSCRFLRTVPFDEDQFRFHSYEDFETNCDLKGDLHDIVGHMKLVNGQTFIEHLIIDEVEIATCCVFCGPVMKLYFWDQTVTDFCKKFKSYENIPTVLLVTTDNTKCLRDCNSDKLHILTYVACGIT